MRTLRLALTAALLTLSTAAAAQATQVSYIDGGHVWVSTLDGSQKKDLSGASPEADKTWTEQAQSDDGYIVGVRRASGQSTGAMTTEWGPDGTKVGDGLLTFLSTLPSAVIPVHLDVVPGGKQIAYGYSYLAYGYPTSTLYSGTWVKNANDVAGQPFDISNLIGSSLFGNRLIGVDSHSGNIKYQEPSGPFASGFADWLFAPTAQPIALKGTGDFVDMAANGKVVATIEDLGTGGASNVVLELYPVDGIGASLTQAQADNGCNVATVGQPRDVTLSQDGTMMAWRDDRGIVVAGTPVWFASQTASTCNLSKAPVVISATGSYPSLGASTVATPASAPATSGATTTTTTTTKTTTTTTAKDPAGVTLAKTVKATSFKNGVTLKVKVKKKGTVKATAKVGSKVLATKTVKAKKKGTVSLRLKASKKVAAKLKSYKGKTLVITITTPSGKLTVKRKLA